MSLSPAFVPLHHAACWLMVLKGPQPHGLPGSIVWVLALLWTKGTARAGLVGSAVTQAAPSDGPCAWTSMCYDHRLEILDNVLCELVFAKGGLMGQWSIHRSLGP